MMLIGRYRNAGFEAVADAVTEFFDRREDLQRPGVAFGPLETESRPSRAPISVLWPSTAAIRSLRPVPVDRAGCQRRP